MVEQKTQIYLFDDDVYPVGRATRAKEELEAKGFRVELYKSFVELKKAFGERRINKEGLFVMDSTIEIEGEKCVTFDETLPWITGAGGIHPRNLMPASGGYSGSDNNQTFVIWLERMERYVCTPEQRGLMVTGMGGDPESVATKIEKYYRTLHPGLGEGRGPGTLR